MSETRMGQIGVTPLDPALKAKLEGISSATVTTILVKKGIRNVFIRGAQPMAEGGRREVGPAFTLRFVPMREDLATPESWGSPISTRAAIEHMEAGVICVADAGGQLDAGIFGDILCQRMAVRGVAALVTDGALRDIAGIEATGLPLWCQGVAAPPSVTALTFVGWNEPVACGGVAVFSGDVIVADDDGAVGIPRALVVEGAETGVEQEAFEAWVVEEGKREIGRAHV